MSKHVDRLRGLWWKVLDPLVMRVASRIEHHARRRTPFAPAERFATIADADKSVVWFEDAEVQGPAGIARIQIGAHCHIRGSLVILGQAGRISMGTHCFVGSGTRIWSQLSVRIGNRVLISHGVDIHDSNAHPVEPARRGEEAVRRLQMRLEPNWDLVKCAAVVVEDDAWIGFKASIMKGVTIGAGAIVAAGAVVAHDVAPGSVVAGNPARVVRSNNGVPR